MSKYFNVTVKPTIKASDQHNGAFTALDLLWDWFAFDMPKGGACLRGVTALVRGVDGAAQTGRDLVLVFAQPSTNGTAPTSLGAEHATVNGVGYYNNLIGAINIDAAGDVPGIDVMNIMATGGGATTDQIPFINIEGRPNLEKDGYNTIYIGGIAGASNTWSFSTEVDIGPSAGVDISASNGTFGVIDGTDPTLCFAPGDVLHAQDDIIVGEIASLDADNIVFKFSGEATESGTSYSVPTTLANWRIQNGAGAAGDLLENDELYNINPITLILHFER